MSLLWHSSREERGHLVRTLYELGPTTIPGLSAALSWPEKRTERLVRELARSGEGGVVFYAASRRVEIPRPEPAPPRTDEPPAAPHGPEEPGPSSLPTPDPPVISSKWSGQSICPECSGTMEPTAHSEALVCRDCGSISSVPRSTRGPVSGSSSSAGTTTAGSGGALGDRRLQELFAAYVTSRPVLCPKCKTPLRHRGLGLYGCPGCGQAVQFTSGGRTAASTR
jgi:hypothetical protein